MDLFCIKNKKQEDQVENRMYAPRAKSRIVDGFMLSTRDSLSLLGATRNVNRLVKIIAL